MALSCYARKSSTPIDMINSHEVEFWVSMGYIGLDGSLHKYRLLQRPYKLLPDGKKERADTSQGNRFKTVR